VAAAVGNDGGAGGGIRPRELEDVFNRRVFHPLSRRLAHALAQTFVTPNMLSLSGAALVLLAGAFYSGFTGLELPAAVAIGFTLHMLWHVVDGADGALARITGRTSPFGEMVDGACDYLSHACLYLMLATFLDDQIGLWAYPLGLASGLSRVAQSNHAESQRRIYLWRAYGVPWILHARDSKDELFGRKGGVGLLMRLTRAYIWLADLLSPASDELDRAAEKAARDPAARRRLTRLCRCASRRPLFVQALLGANPRTLMLGLSMAFGTPLFFFLVETTVMNLLLIVSVRRQRSCNETLGQRLTA
jgi:hypothetical protein